jgi:hypothetical protein
MAWQLPSLTVLRLNHNRLETLGEPALGRGLDSLTSLEVHSIAALPIDGNGR